MSLQKPDSAMRYNEIEIRSRKCEKYIMASSSDFKRIEHISEKRSIPSDGIQFAVLERAKSQYTFHENLIFQIIDESI